MPDNPPRRVSRGNVSVRRRGIIKGWETAEVCNTGNLLEVGRYLRGFDPGTRVWVTAYGYIHLPSDPELDEDTGKPIVTSRNRKAASRRGDKEHLTVMANTELQDMTDPDIQWDTLRRMAVFYDPSADDYDIEYFCVRTKEPL